MSCAWFRPVAVDFDGEAIEALAANRPTAPAPLGGGRREWAAAMAVEAGVWDRAHGPATTWIGPGAGPRRPAAWTRSSEVSAAAISEAGADAGRPHGTRTLDPPTRLPGPGRAVPGARGGASARPQGWILKQIQTGAGGQRGWRDPGVRPAPTDGGAGAVAEVTGAMNRAGSRSLARRAWPPGGRRQADPPTRTRRRRTARGARGSSRRWPPRGCRRGCSPRRRRGGRGGRMLRGGTRASRRPGGSHRGGRRRAGPDLPGLAEA